MNKSAMTCASLLLVCLWLTSAAQATIVDADEEWGTKLDSGESITCIAHYIPDVPDVPDSLIFQQAPEPTSTYSFGDWDGWETAISADQKMVYLYGPRQTNPTDFNNVEWFSYNLFFQWDDADPNLDPDYPVYLDTALFDGGLGSDATDAWFWKGEPGGWPDGWVREEYPHNPDYEEDYTNPTPEPMTICLLGLGAALLRKKRKRKALSLSNKEDNHPLC